MPYKPIRKTFPFCLLFIASYSHAEEIEMAPVQVWGTQVFNSSNAIDKEDIEIKQADHLSDLLRDAPGVDIGGAHSTNQRINIRGLQDTDLEITIDGARQNNFMYHHMGNLLINADILKAVDIKVGTNSIINDGLGGGIAFETKDAKDLLAAQQLFGSRIHAAYATNDYISYSLTGYGKLDEKADALAYFNVSNRNNPEYGNGVESVGNDGKIRNALFKFGWDINNEQRLELSYDQYGDEGDYAPRPDMGAATNSAITGTIVYPTEFERRTLSLNYEADLGDALFLKASIYRNEMDLWRDEALNARAKYRYAEGSSTHTGGKILAETILASGDIEHMLRYGFDTYRQETEYKQDSAFISGESARSTAIFLEDEILFSDNFSVTPGIRYNHYALDSKVADKNFSKLTWGLATRYDLNDNWRFNASTTRLFKAPMLAEVFTGAGNNLQPNPDLEPVTGVNNQISLHFHQRNILALDSVRMGITLFKTEFNNYIDDEGSGTYVNLGDYDVDGFETSLNIRKGFFTANLSYSKSKSEHQVTGEPLGRQVGDSLALGFGYEMPKHGLVFNWQSLVTFDEDYFDKEGYDVHNISVKWLPKSVKNLNLTLGVENIFDEYYVSHASRVGDTVHPVFGALHLNDYEPGRNVKLSLSYSF